MGHERPGLNTKRTNRGVQDRARPQAWQGGLLSARLHSKGLFQVLGDRGIQAQGCA